MSQLDSSSSSQREKQSTNDNINRWPTNMSSHSDSSEDRITDTINKQETTSSLSINEISQLQRLGEFLSQRTSRCNNSQNISSDDNDEDIDLQSSIITETFDIKKEFQTFVNNADNQGIHLRKSGVTIEDIGCIGQDSSSLEGSTVSDILLLPYTIFKKIKSNKKNKMRIILQNINGLAKPGEMILVLGRPGAGCSSLLKLIAGINQTFAGGCSGEITYDGIPQKEMLQKFKSDIIYNGEEDVHFPYLTVQQTIDFAIGCKTPAKRINGLTKDQYVTRVRDLYATIFGLTHTYHTRVGNDFVRGISGGERKRVSIVEALATNGSIFCWDNATRGLDASTALEYANAIRVMTNILGSTAFVTIYQASENIYEKFDKVTIIHSGKQIFFGDIFDAKKYFDNMGFICPERQSTAEYLTGITDPNGYHIIKPGFEHLVPKTADEFENYWLQSSYYKQLRQDIQIYKNTVDTEETKELYRQSIEQDKSKYARKKSAYTISFPEQVRLCTRRAFQRIYGNMTAKIINIVAAVVQSFVAGSLFYQAPSSTSGAFSRGGVLYFCLLYYSLMSLANMDLSHRPIMMKHKYYTLYHPAAEAMADAASGFPFRMIGLTSFLIIIYFLAGLHRTPSAFFIVYLFLIMCSESINGMFQMVAAGCDTLAQAHSIAGILMMSISMYSTYMIQLPSMHPWFKWISYILPIRYAFESMLNAEFHGRHMDCGGTLIPSGPAYVNASSNNRACAFVGAIPGQSYVLGDDYLREQFQYQYKDTWRNFGIMWCFLIGTGDALIFKKGAKHIHQPNDEESLDKNIDIKETYTSPDETNSENSDNDFEHFDSEGTFIWKNVCYTVPYDGSEKLLLDNVSGFCVPGTLTALVGESGAGKTTLLNTLAKRNVGKITGDMLLNGLPIDASFERRTGYVQQQDAHIAELTVRESLIFSARMRRPESVPDAEKCAYVEKIINVLDMRDYADVLVGTVGSGLNVEQRKKLSIGVELVAKPDVLLFLDEPTSGLDSQSSWSIIQLLKKLKEAGQTILCTIHQPSATLFEQFDRLLLLRKGGQTVYFGDIGNNSDILISYFEKYGARKCSPTENPAEYILEVIGAGATEVTDVDWHQVWLNSEEGQRAREEVDENILDLAHKHSMSERNDRPRKYATSYFYQFKYVYLRTALTFWRSTSYIISKLMLMTVAGLYVGFTFFNPGNSRIGMQNTMFAVMISIILSAPLMNQMQVRAIATRDLFEVRESKSNMFHWSLIMTTQYLSEIPYQFVFSTIYFVSSYFPLRNRFEASRSGVYYLHYCVMFQLYFTSLGLMILYMSPNLASANLIMGLCLGFLIAFCGVVQPMRLMPGFWTFMWKASPYTYYIQSLIGIMLHEKPVICSKKELTYFNPPEGQTCGEYMTQFFKTGTGYLTDPDATTNCGYCIYSVGDEYLDYISAPYSNLWRNFGFYFAYTIFNMFAMVALYYIFHVRKLIILDPEKISKLLKKLHIKK
ncbi:ATP-binding cassette transporter snq2 [Maudiozyma exigua]|uniref:ATP-binding cassette transporter snq2 n=1 Tax=Maudiozyma exigua TaxID=34358 RepID=A0A9P6W3Y0_MAUEX|nr:ATP-binding cassette transporter snq2 [Kazachstania exigua]